MENKGRLANRRRLTLLTVAALLVVAGLVSAMSAPGAPPRSNKADAYGGPVQPKPTNPKNRAACDSYWGAKNDFADAKDCRAIAKRNTATRKCAKKSGAARAKCQKAAKKRYAKDKAAVAKQRKAEKACIDKYNKDSEALDPNADDYPQKSEALSTELNDCMTRARS